jgi:hypothetical protein
MTIRRVVVAVLGALLVASTATATEDAYTHSIRVTDAQGNPVQGAQPVVVTLYSDAGGTNTLWQRTLQVDFDDGYGSIELDAGDSGSVNPVWFESPVYIGTSVGGSTLGGPTLIHAVPYASVAGRMTGRTIVDNAGVSEWSDGQGSASCLTYRYPNGSDRYAGAGASGNGPYKLDSDGAGPRPAYSAYCDMTTIYDDDGVDRWQPFGEAWAQAGAFGGGATAPDTLVDARSRAYGEVSGNEFMLYYNGAPFLRTDPVSSCLGNGSMLGTFGQVYWNETMWKSCPVSFHDQSLGEKALSCTAGVTNCGLITYLRIGWGEDEHQNTGNSDQTMISSNRRNNVSSIGGLGARKSNTGHQCGTCIYGDASGDTDAPSFIAGPQVYGMFVR